MVKATTDPKVWGVPTQALRNARHLVNIGELPSDKTMRKRLKAAGWKRVQEEDWTP